MKKRLFSDEIGFDERLQINVDVLVSSTHQQSRRQLTNDFNQVYIDKPERHAFARV